VLFDPLHDPGLLLHPLCGRPTVSDDCDLKRNVIPDPAQSLQRKRNPLLLTERSGDEHAKRLVGTAATRLERDCIDSNAEVVDSDFLRRAAELYDQLRQVRTLAEYTIDMAEQSVIPCPPSWVFVGQPICVDAVEGNDMLEPGATHCVFVAPADVAEVRVYHRGAVSSGDIDEMGTVPTETRS